MTFVISIPNPDGSDDDIHIATVSSINEVINSIKEIRGTGITIDELILLDELTEDEQISYGDIYIYRLN